MSSPLPDPSAEAQVVSKALSGHIASEIADKNGWISFSRYQELALYTPQLGYYAGGSHKFGEGGDFVTAPEISPLFGYTLARQIAEILAASQPFLLEVGAGSGRLAADLLNGLAQLNVSPERYLILELSGELRARQQETVRREAPHLAHRVEWLDALPEHFSGCVIANELLDAMPVHAVAWREEGIMERGIMLDEQGKLAWSERPAFAALNSAAAELQEALNIVPPYLGEISLAARAWTAEWGSRLDAGALLLIDYGLPNRELYHPQRNGGSLRCHYRHHAHDNPFWWPGLSDITTHVDFTAIAESGHAAGLEVLGYTSQANFLMNCGFGELLAERQATATTGAKSMGSAQFLLSPNEMGELFKVIALARNLPLSLNGFSRGDRIHAL